MRNRLYTTLLLLLAVAPASAQRFLPLEQGNIWIYRWTDHGRLGLRGEDTLVVSLDESARVSHAGREYFRLPRWPIHGYSDFFREDVNGNILSPTEHPADLQARFEAAFTDTSEFGPWTQSVYYDYYRNLIEAAAVSGEVVAYDFQAEIPGFETFDPAIRLIDVLFADKVAWEVLMGSFGEAILPLERPDDGRRSFAWLWIEGRGELVFEEDIGLVEARSSSPIADSEYRYELLWARVDGREYGAHPGPRFPGATAVRASTWGEAKRTGKASPRRPLTHRQQDAPRRLLGAQEQPSLHPQTARCCHR